MTQLPTAKVTFWSRERFIGLESLQWGRWDVLSSTLGNRPPAWKFDAKFGSFEHRRKPLVQKLQYLLHWP